MSSALPPRRTGRPGASGDVSCRYVTDRVGDYVDGSLPQAEHHLVDQHLLHCSSCEREVQLEHEVRRGIRDVEAPGTPLALADRLVAIGGADQTVWFSSGADELPSVRARRRQAAGATIGTMVLVVALVAVVGWVLAPGLPAVHGLGESAAGEAGAAVPASAGPNDPVLAALDALPSRRGAPASSTGSGVNLAPGRPAQAPKPLEADAASLLLGSWPSNAAIGASICTVSGCSEALVRGSASSATGSASGLALTVFENGAPAASVAWTPLAGVPGGSRWSFLGTAVVAGVQAAGLEATTERGTVLRRWWVAASDLHLVQLESYRAGRLAATAVFHPADSAGETSCPDSFTCPDQLAGMGLVSVATDVPSAPQQVRLLYAEQDRSVVVVEQHGRLVGTPQRVTVHGFTVQSWQSRDLVVAVTSPRGELLDAACSGLPHDPPSAPSGLRRIKLGWEHLGGR